MKLNHPVLKYLLIAFTSILGVITFAVVMAKLTMGDKRTINEPDISDDNRMFSVEVQQCDCWYRAEDGDVSALNEGLGCNILVMDKVDKSKLPECTHPDSEDSSILNSNN